MKKLFFLVAIGILFVVSGYAQQPEKDTLPYLKYPALPAFNMRLMDSETIFNTYNIPKGKPAMLVLFSPDCQHCQKFFKEFMPAMDSFQNVDFYIITAYSKMSALRSFAEEFHFDKYKNIKMVGRDYEFFCPVFYGLRSVPDLILYDKNKKLVKLIDHGGKASEIYQYTSNLQ
jgi:thioredoxin-related protein